MPNLLRYLCGLIGLWACTGCFEIREEVKMSEDGSGNYAFLLDMSESKTLLAQNAEAQPDSIQQNNFLADIQDALTQLQNQLHQMEGIREANIVHEPINYRFGFSFRFDDLTQLNQALSTITQQPEPVAFYRHDKKNFHRLPLFAFRDLIYRERPEQSDDDRQQMLATRTRLMAQAKYVFVFHNPYKIKKYDGGTLKSPQVFEARYPLSILAQEPEQVAFSLKLSGKF
ncbi:MAG: hypothetical protein ACFCUI_10550 [Bernardetiaceae bacterium]